MPEDEFKKPFPQDLINISYPKTADQPGENKKTPEQVIKDSSLDEIFGPYSMNKSSMFQQAIMYRPENALLMLAKEGVTAEHIFMPDLNGNNGLHCAARTNNRALVLEILDRKDVTAEHIDRTNVQGNTPLGQCFNTLKVMAAPDDSVRKGDREKYEQEKASIEAIARIIQLKHAEKSGHLQSESPSPVPPPKLRSV